MNILDTVDHIAIQVSNIEKSLMWYIAKFNCKVIYSDDTWALIKFNNINIALVNKKQHPPHFAILNENITLKNGATVHRDGSISKYINDIDSNFIELIKY
mgnify:FL=1|tara:strand:+ start:7992 stop:8291 length:300 start_codon:yes stop_codon:yes gene_type:complete